MTPGPSRSIQSLEAKLLALRGEIGRTQQETHQFQDIDGTTVDRNVAVDVKAILDNPNRMLKRYFSEIFRIKRVTDANQQLLEIRKLASELDARLGALGENIAIYGSQAENDDLVEFDLVNQLLTAIDHDELEQAIKIVRQNTEPVSGAERHELLANATPIERALISANFPVEEWRRLPVFIVEVNKDGKEVVKEGAPGVTRLDTYAHALFSLLIHEGKADFTHRTLGLPNIAAQHVDVENKNGQKESFSVEDLIKSLAHGLSGRDSLEATTIVEKYNTARAAINNIIAGDDAFLRYDSSSGKYVGAATSLDGLIDFYPQAGSTKFDPWVFKSTLLDKLMYMDENGTWVWDDKPFWQKYLLAQQEMIRGGRRYPKNPSHKGDYDWWTTVDENVAEKANARVLKNLKAYYMLVKENGKAVWKQVPFRVKSVDPETNILPRKWALPHKVARRNANWWRAANKLLPENMSISDPKGKDGEDDLTFAKRSSEHPARATYAIDVFAMYLAEKFMNITGESASHDAEGGDVKKKDSQGRDILDASGKPTYHLTASGKIMHAPGGPDNTEWMGRGLNFLDVVLKYSTVSGSGGGVQDFDEKSPEEAFIADFQPGLFMASFGWSVLDFFGFDGYSLGEHLATLDIEHTTLEDVKKMFDRALPSDATNRYGAMIGQHLPLVKACYEATIDLLKTVKLNIETNRVSETNVSQFRAWAKHVRYLDAYTMETNSTVRAIMPDPAKYSADKYVYDPQMTPEKVQEMLKGVDLNPTGDFIGIQIESKEVDKNGEPLFRQPLYVTRIHTLYPMHPYHLIRWMPNEILSDLEWGQVDPRKDPFNLDQLFVFKIPIKKLKTEVKRREDMPSANQLIRAELGYRHLFAFAYFGDKIQALQREDLAGLTLMTVGSEAVRKYQSNYWKGPLSQIETEFIADLIPVVREQIYAQTPNIIGQPIFTFDQIPKVRALLGEQLTFSKLMQDVNTVFSLGANATKKK